jgi:RNA polymerase sigma-70 factor, ECF subfamily
MQDEPALLQAAKMLDPDALVAIFDQYAPAVYRYAYRLCHDAIVADNIVGDTFAALLEQFSGGNGPVANLRSYIFQVAYHLIVDQARYNHQLMDLETDLEVPRGLVTVSVESQIDERMLMRNLLYAINNDLSELQRHVIILRFLQGFSLKETAVIVCKEVNHVKVIQNRGIAKLRKSLRFQ